MTDEEKVLKFAKLLELKKEAEVIEIRSQPLWDEKCRVRAAIRDIEESLQIREQRFGD